eukprot:10899286-Karenia_brevis.AAC.1
MERIRPAVVARVAHEIEFGFRDHGSVVYTAFGPEEKLFLVMCCHHRKIPSRFTRAGYIPPRGDRESFVPEQ